MQVDEFYIRNQLRVHEILVGKKCPIETGWPDSQKPYSEVNQQLLSDRYNKYGWLLDDCHVVIDIDVHNEEEDGYVSLKKFEDDCGVKLDEICKATVQTPSGGKHYYFSKPVGFSFGKSFKAKYPGIDFISGKGKQVVAAGSAHDKHDGVYKLSPNAELVPLCFGVLSFLQSLKTTSNKPASTSTGDRSGDDFNKSQRGLGILVSELTRLGYVVRPKYGYFEFDRPNKTTDSTCSGHVGKLSKQGNYQLTCFSLSDPFFPSGEPMTIFHAYALIKHAGNEKDAAKELYELGFAEQLDVADISFILNSASSVNFTDEDDEDFAAGCVPDDGIIKQVFDLYESVSHRFSPMMGLAVAISFCQVLFGRRIRSHTDLRTNDYNVIIAPTNSGKEACERTITKIFEAADPDLSYLVPPDVQSGNGLIKAVAERRCCIWVSDEFGLTLRSILDKKQKNHHQQQIATHLLKLYGKAEGVYLGAAHAAGTKNPIVQPHLCLLGLTTGSTLFESTDVQNVSDGLFGRIAFWPIQRRPARRRMRSVDVPSELVEATRAWIDWLPGGNLGSENPQPKTIDMDDDALDRWISHADQIDERMCSESELRNAIWGRVSARAMKLALVYRVAKIHNPKDANWDTVHLRLEDVNWGIKIANWLARICCQLVVENFPSDQLLKVKKMILAAVSDQGEISKRDVERANRSISSSDIMAAAIELENNGLVKIEKIKTGGRPREIFKRPA